MSTVNDNSSLEDAHPRRRHQQDSDLRSTATSSLGGVGGPFDDPADLLAHTLTHSGAGGRPRELSGPSQSRRERLLNEKLLARLEEEYRATV